MEERIFSVNCVYEVCTVDIEKVSIKKPFWAIGPCDNFESLFTPVGRGLRLAEHPEEAKLRISKSSSGHGHDLNLFVVEVGGPRMLNRCQVVTVKGSRMQSCCLGKATF